MSLGSPNSDLKASWLTFGHSRSTVLQMTGGKAALTDCLMEGATGSYALNPGPGSAKTAGSSSGRCTSICRSGHQRHLHGHAHRGSAQPVLLRPGEGERQIFRN